MAIVDDQTKRKLKRNLRKRRKEAHELGQQADSKLETLFIRRFDRLNSVRRFIGLWSALLILLFFATFLQLRSLSNYYQSLQPVAGGLYNEGLVGSFTNANPLYASGEANTAISRLVFSGLFKYDQNNRLVGDLATSYDLSDSQTRYTVHLRHGVKWQDGAPFTADDVVYTYQTIQNINAQSSLYSSWQGINVTKADDYTVNFDLPNPFSPFPYSLTNGIVPAHLLKSIAPEQLRSANFNTLPVGTGPFEWKFVEVGGTSTDTRQQRITLAAYKNYYAGPPKLDGFSLITYSSEDQLVSAFKGKQLNAMSGLEEMPASLQKDTSVRAYVTPLTTEVMAFFNNSRPVLDQATVRQALVSGVDRSAIASLTAFPVRLINGPLLKGQLGYVPGVGELAFNQSQAASLLDQAGWTLNSSGQRVKDGQVLTFDMSSQNTPTYTKVASYLQSQWAKLGVKVNVQYYDSNDLQASVVGSHSYDILLYGINVGVDPDVFAYWDSSQASLTSQGHLNLSEYKSSAADSALEAGRTRVDPAIRATKYAAFMTAWVNDAPALALYQSNSVYITRGPVFNFQRSSANSDSDRFYNVNGWEIRQKRQNIIK